MRPDHARGDQPRSVRSESDVPSSGLAGGLRARSGLRFSAIEWPFERSQSRAERLGPAVARWRPSGEKSTLSIGPPWSSAGPASSPVSDFQSRARESAAAVRARVPSGLKATASTGPPCHSAGAIGRPDASSQSCAVRVFAAGERPSPVGADGHGGHSLGGIPAHNASAEPSDSSDRCSGGSPVAGPADPPGRIPGPGPTRAGRARSRSACTGSHPL